MSQEKSHKWKKKTKHLICLFIKAELQEGDVESFVKLYSQIGFKLKDFLNLLVTQNECQSSQLSEVRCQ